MADTIESVPITLAVPLGNMKETDLMAALEAVVEHWDYSVHGRDPEGRAETARAVRWLHDKYGAEGVAE